MQTPPSVVCFWGVGKGTALGACAAPHLWATRPEVPTLPRRSFPEARWARHRVRLCKSQLKDRDLNSSVPLPASSHGAGRWSSDCDGPVPERKRTSSTLARDAAALTNEFKTSPASQSTLVVFQRWQDDFVYPRFGLETGHTLRKPQFLSPRSRDRKYECNLKCKLAAWMPSRCYPAVGCTLFGG